MRAADWIVAGVFITALVFIAWLTVMDAEVTQMIAFLAGVYVGVLLPVMGQLFRAAVADRRTYR